jgi:hypothetical protein
MRGMTKTLGSDVQQAFANKVEKLIVKESRKRIILFKFASSLTMANPYEVNRKADSAKETLESILSANFYLYPSPNKDFLYNLEVRFLLPGMLTHGFFVDYGKDGICSKYL